VKTEVIRDAVSVMLGIRSDWRLHRHSIPLKPQPGLAWSGPLLLLTITGVGWFAFADAVGDEDNVAFSLFIGSVSILLMAWSNILSTRLRILEPFFGGLDRMYRWHRWFGALSVATMWLHIQFVDDVKGIAGASKDVADAAEELAGLGETVLYVLVIASLVRWVPYRWWRQSHKLLIFAFATASWHFHTSTKPYANESFWGRWFQVIMLMGLVAWVYRVLWRDGVRRGRRYHVSSVVTQGSTTTIDLMPVGRALKWKAGQFVFVRIGAGALAEPHPFTVASVHVDGYVRLVIKSLGDWSDKLASRVSLGAVVRVEGPYGGLQLLPREQKTVVWIAGGVGITPFLAGSRLRKAGIVPHLFYAVRSRDDAPGLAQLEQEAAEGRIVLHLCVSSEGSRLTSEFLVNQFAECGLSGAHIVMCGSDSLVRDMTAAVRTLGAHHVHVEKFDIRTGIGPDLSREVEGLTQRLPWRISRHPR
jgi:predicted ferric reductase